MHDEDRVDYVDDFNPLEWIMELWCIAKDRESDKAMREFMFETPLTEAGVYNYQVVFHYLQKKVNTPEKRQLLIIINKENTHLVGFADVNGIPPEIIEKYNG